jgi:hypothetical protein
MVLSLLLMVGTVPDTGVACPSCRDALASQESLSGTPEDGFGQTGEAVSLSVLFMLAMPFTLLAGFGTGFYLISRRPGPSERPQL